MKSIIQIDSPTTVTQDTIGLVRQYCNKLELPPNIAEASREVAEKVCNIGVIDGRNPSTVATASILHAVNLFKFDKVSKRNISCVSRTAENTITNAYNIMMTNSEDLTPSAYKEKKEEQTIKMYKKHSIKYKKFNFKV